MSELKKEEIKEVDLDKQRIQSAQSRNRRAMKKEWFGI